jgi:peptidoglycan/LPS O-acetylase OafA/YrhL
VRNVAIAAGRVDALDGLRGLAILMVLALHLRWLGFGWIGVQLFFVLSGFLITRLLARSAADRSLGEYLKDFYARRALRIFPLYFAYLLAIAIASWTFVDFPPVERALPWAATFTFNLFRLTPGYADLGAGTQRHALIDHFWSLAVEEHFYLYWPLLLFLLRRHLRVLALALVVAGPLLRAFVALGWEHLPWVQGTVAHANYMLSTSHIDAFAIGALVATLPQPALFARDARHYGWLFGIAAGCALIAGAWANGGLVDPSRPLGSPLHLGFPLTMPNAGQHVWGYSLVNLLAAGAIWLSLHAKSWQRVFTQGWLRYTGRISFGMYVLHFPMMQLLPALNAWTAQLSAPLAPILSQAIYLALVYAMAGLSFRFYEQPFLDLKQRLPRATARQDVPVAG